MHALHRPPAELQRLASLQADVVTTEQVRGCGLGRRPVERLLAEGYWGRMSNGLYLTRSGEPDWPAWAWGGVLLGGPAARLGGAAALHAAAVLEQSPDPIDVLVPHRRIMAPQTNWRWRRERPGVRDARSPGNPPRQPIEDAVIDLCADRESDDVVTLVTRAVQSQRTTPHRLLRALERRARVHHRDLLLALLQETAEGAESALEIRYLHDVERAHGLPRGTRQARAKRAAHVRDVLYEEFGVVTELDGLLNHTGMGRFRDMDRDNLAVLSGEITLRYGWFDVNGRPCRVAAQVAFLITQRGWSGTLQPCSRCRLVPADELWVS